MPPKRKGQDGSRPDITAAERGGDWNQGMDGEMAPNTATMRQALYWTQVYTEILTMEEKVLARVRNLMSTQSTEVQREVEQTNVPVIVAQAERFRQRLSYWCTRLDELQRLAETDGHPAESAGR